MSDAWFPPLAVHDTTWFQPLQILTNITFPFLIDLMSNFHSLLQWNLYKSLPLIPEMRIKKLSLDEDYFLVRIFFFQILCRVFGTFPPLRLLILVRKTKTT